MYRALRGNDSTNTKLIFNAVYSRMTFAIMQFYETHLYFWAVAVWNHVVQIFNGYVNEGIVLFDWVSKVGVLPLGGPVGSSGTPSPIGTDGPVWGTPSPATFPLPLSHLEPTIIKQMFRMVSSTFTSLLVRFCIRKPAGDLWRGALDDDGPPRVRPLPRSPVAPLFVAHLSHIGAHSHHASVHELQLQL